MVGDMPTSEMLTTSDVAHLLNLHVNTVMLRRGGRA